MARSTAPTLSLTKRTFSQLSPPSLDRKTPRSSFFPKAMPQGRRIDQIGVRGMDPDPPNEAGFRKPLECPGVPSVGGPVNAPSGLHVPPDPRGSGADVDDVGVRRSHFHGSDGGNIEEPVGDVLPALACVRGLPDASSGGSLEEGQRLPGNARHSRGPTSPEGPDEPEFHGGKHGGIDELVG